MHIGALGLLMQRAAETRSDAAVPIHPVEILRLTELMRDARGEPNEVDASNLLRGLALIPPYPEVRALRAVTALRLAAFPGSLAAFNISSDGRGLPRAASRAGLMSLSDAFRSLEAALARADQSLPRGGEHKGSPATGVDRTGPGAASSPAGAMPPPRPTVEGRGISQALARPLEDCHSIRGLVRVVDRYCAHHVGRPSAIEVAFLLGQVSRVLEAAARSGRGHAPEESDLETLSALLTLAPGRFDEAAIADASALLRHLPPTDAGIRLRLQVLRRIDDARGTPTSPSAAAPAAIHPGAPGVGGGGAGPAPMWAPVFARLPDGQWLPTGAYMAVPAEKRE